MHSMLQVHWKSLVYNVHLVFGNSSDGIVEQNTIGIR